MTVRTRCGWVKFIECGELLNGRRFPVKLKIYSSHIYIYIYVYMQYIYAIYIYMQIYKVCNYVWEGSSVPGGKRDRN